MVPLRWVMTTNCVFSGIGAQVVGVVVDIGVVQRSLDLVEYAERRGFQIEHGEEYGDGRQRPLAAGKQR